MDTLGRTDTWRTCLPGAEAERYDPASEQEFGVCPAVLVVDVTEAYRNELYEAHGETHRAMAVLNQSRAVLEGARNASARIVFLVPEPPDPMGEGPRWKHQGPPQPVEAFTTVCAELAHDATTEALLRKPAASAFFGTDLVGRLMASNVDTVIVMGFVTSGCVLATVMDAFSLRYRVFVPEDAVDDRSRVSHDVALFNIHHKYGDVLPAERISALLVGDRRPGHTRS